MPITTPRQPASPYEHPGWAEVKTDLSEDAIQTVIWFALRDSCTGELSKIFHYLMWVLDARYGGSHTFTIEVASWPFPDDDTSFAFYVRIECDGTEVACVDAFSSTDGRLKWSFGTFDGEDVSQSDDLDLSTRSGLSHAMRVLERCISTEVSRKRR